MNTWLVLHECCGPHFSYLHSHTPPGGVFILRVAPSTAAAASCGIMVMMTDSGSGNGEGRRVERWRQPHAQQLLA